MLEWTPVLFENTEIFEYLYLYIFFQKFLSEPPPEKLTKLSITENCLGTVINM